MKTFRKSAAQGEVDIMRVESLPPDAKKIEPVNGFYIVGHSETGHHHVLAARSGVEVYEGTQNGFKVLFAILQGGEVLEHQRTFDTHERIQYDAGPFLHGNLVERDPYADLIRRQAD
jgi:hypothetical protein